MKATFYAAFYDASPDKVESLPQIAALFLGELETFEKSHSPQKPRDFFGILSELDTKWRALSKLRPAIAPHGFQVVMSEYNPELFGAWGLHCKKKGTWKD